ATLPPLARCFGRECEIYELVDQLLADEHVPVPIVGAPGIGKTTIALAALHESRVAERYNGRRYFIRCDGIQTRDALIVQIGLAFALSPSPNLRSAVISELSISPAVLFLDNVETPWES